MPGIYSISINDKIYIGSAAHFRKRWTIHKHDLKYNKHANDFLQKLWNKYQHATFEILCYCPESCLLGIEQYYLDIYYDNRINCCNICSIAGNTLGVKRPDLAERNKAKKGMKHSQETIQKMKESHTGHNVSDATKKKMSEAAVGKIKTEEHKQRLSESRTGKFGGENCGCSKLTWELVKNIREDYSVLGYSQKNLSVKYNMSTSTIFSIVHNDTWKA